MLNYPIFDRSGSLLFTAKIDCDEHESDAMKKRLAVFWAIKNHVPLSNANLSDANLSDVYFSDVDFSNANLSNANLFSADLTNANLSNANLFSADLTNANLSHANLSRANLSHANLSLASLYNANLSHANLSRAYLPDSYFSCADLSCADLSYANLSRANFYDSNLSDVDFSNANLSDADFLRSNFDAAINAEESVKAARVAPEGDIEGWKKCKNDVIVKLRIPAAARRSNAFGRKCRAEYAQVLEVIGADVGVSSHDNKILYHAGKTVKPDKWCDKFWEECSSGIHFFLTREEAEAYQV